MNIERIVFYKSTKNNSYTLRPMEPKSLKCSRIQMFCLVVCLILYSPNKINKFQNIWNSNLEISFGKIGTGLRIFSTQCHYKQLCPVILEKYSISYVRCMIKFSCLIVNIFKNKRKISTILFSSDTFLREKPTKWNFYERKAFKSLTHPCSSSHAIINVKTFF